MIYVMTISKYPRATDRDALLAVLNELLEAERAGARVALCTAKEVGDSELKALVTAIQHDEAHWCDVLVRAIQELESVPSKKTGAFFEKAMAITDVSSRLAFLNRGQGWVVRKLEALLPTLRVGPTHDELNVMLTSHERNIVLVAAKLESSSGPEAVS
jgi:hypothetical protein